MSRKVRQYKENREESNMEVGSTQDISRTTTETLDKIVETLNDNKLLIGAIAAGCGVAIFLLATESGKRLRDEITDKSLDAYDLVSEKAAKAVDRLRDFAEDLLSERNVEPVSRNIRRVS